MKKHQLTIFTFCLFIFCKISNAQKKQLTEDSCCKKKQYYIGITSPNIDNSVYTAMQNIWYANERISYICVPKFGYLETPKIPLREGEGKNGKFLFDANIYEQLPILMGRNHGNHLWQTSRLTFDFSLSLRMALDSSNPVLPYNDIIGITYDKVLWDSHTKLRPFSHSSNSSFSDWNNLEQSLQNLSMNITAHHYSNGQQPGFFRYDTINGNPERRNDYKKGDFSTNYLQIGFTYTNLRPSRSLFSFKVAYQKDGNVVGPLSYSVEQEKSYGHDRINGFIQYRKIWKGHNTKTTKVLDLCDTCHPKKELQLYKNYELVFRVDYEYILGDLSEYPHANKYRFNPHLFIQFTRPNWRALGFVFHAYYGRDYTNIRYDLPIWTLMAGISINLNKYRPPFSNRQKYN